SVLYEEGLGGGELAKLVGWGEYREADLSVSRGRREEALYYLKEARRKFPDLWRATLFYYAVKLTPQAVLLRTTYNTSYKLNYMLGQIWRNERTVGYLANKLLRRFGGALRWGIAIPAHSLDLIPSLDLSILYC